MKKTFKELTQNIDMLLFNKIIEIDYELELEAWSDIEYYDSEEYNKDIYQYFVISEYYGRYLSKVTGMPLFYSLKCDLFILWVDFLDNWQNMSYEI